MSGLAFEKELAVVGVAHLFRGGGREFRIDSCPPRLKPWATQSGIVAAGPRTGRADRLKTGPTVDAAAAPRGGRRAMLLLEVVVATAILVAAMGMLSAQLVSGLRMTAQAEELTTASQLADRILALVELDPNTVQRFFEQREIDGDFDSDVYEQYRGWFWRATVEELPDDEELGRVTIEILRARDAEGRDDIEGAQIVRTLHLLKANPGLINLAEDFGIPEEQLEMFMSMVPIPGLDPAAFDPQALVSLDPEMLLELLPVILPLIQQFSGGKLPEGMSADMLRDLMGADAFGGGAAGALPGGGLDAGAADAIRSMLGSQLSDEELDGLLNNIGQGGDGAFAPGSADGESRPGRGRNVNDLDRERDENNRRFNDRRGGRR